MVQSRKAKVEAPVEAKAPADVVMARFALPAWPGNTWFVPAGTIIEVAIGPDGEIAEQPVWNGITLPISRLVPPPMDACGLDREAALLMLKAYPEHWHRLGFARELDREALLAEGRARIERGEWPRWLKT
jgi:hypothetical protein